MTEAIIVALITGAFSLGGVLVSNHVASVKMQTNLEKHQAVTETKLEDLTREVREHNNFARRVPVLEEQMKVTNNRLKDLERAKN